MRQDAPRARILAAADDLFRRQGIRGVGVEAIAAAARTNKMTLYRHFASKDELIAEWIRGVVAQKEAAWEEIASKHPDDPRAQLVQWSKRNVKALAQMQGRGSVIQNALAELPETDHPARQVIDEHRRREHRRIAELFREAGSGEPELAADQFYFLLEGAKNCTLAAGMGMRRIGEHLVRIVESMVASTGTRAARR